MSISEQHTTIQCDWNTPATRSDAEEQVHDIAPVDRCGEEITFHTSGGLRQPVDDHGTATLPSWGQREDRDYCPRHTATLRVNSVTVSSPSTTVGNLFHQISKTLFASSDRLAR
jgi:hypothetical protein